jgi:precorrin-6Y C5,15-methyltransferase (decarboxylating)
MAEPWLTIIGVSEDGLAGCSDGSRAAIERAERIFGAARHLALVHAGARGQEWPSPFDVAPVLAWRGRPVVVLASGDPFWYGVGGTLARHLPAHEWVAYPGPSTFSWAAARLGWRLEDTACLGLHSLPSSTVRPWLRRGQRLIALLRDAAQLHELAALASELGYGASAGWALQRLGGPHERVVPFTLHEPPRLPELQAPLAVAFWLRDGPAGLPVTPGLPDACFVHDGVITKSPMRALTLRALAPRPGEVLWDLGAGAGSVAIEWCLAGGLAHAVERLASRAAHIQLNAQRLGVQPRLHVHATSILEALPRLPEPQAVFAGGGFDIGVFDALRARLPAGCRLVVNAVTLATMACLQSLHARWGGELWQFTITQAQPLGGGHAWQPARPWMQWIWGVDA